MAAYWVGYANNGIRLEALPEYIDVVHLFTLNIWPIRGLNNDLLTSGGMSWEEIIVGAHALQKRGTRVLASIVSTPYPRISWNTIPDPVEFAERVASQVIDEWGLDGIDIDPEIGDGETPNETFVSVVEALSRYFGPQSGSGRMMTFVSREMETDWRFLQRTHTLFDYIGLMGYFWPMTEMKNQFEQYAAIVGAKNLLFGFSTANPSTPLHEVIQLARWQPQREWKGGMMEFNINADTGFTYAGAIHESLTCC